MVFVNIDIVWMRVLLAEIFLNQYEGTSLGS